MILLAIMDSAESYISTISAGDDIERRTKQSEGKIPVRGNSDTSLNKQKRLKMTKMQVKRNLSLIKIALSKHVVVYKGRIYRYVELH